MPQTPLIEFAIQFVGVVLGVLFAFWLDRWWERRSKRGNTVFILRAIKDELVNNMNTLDKIKSLLDSSKQNSFAVPYDHVNAGIWKAFYGTNSIANTKVLADLNLAYLNFEDFETLYGRYLGLAYFAIRKGLKVPKETLREMELHRTELLAKINVSCTFAQTVIPELDHELTRLSA